MVQQLLPAPGSADLSDEELLARYDPGDAPMVRFNFVSTADGAATHQGVTGTLGTAGDKRIFALLRRHADVILIGAGTIRAEGYGGELLDARAQAWRAERGLAPHPAIAVVSGSLNLDPEMPFFTKAPVRPIVITSASAPDNRRHALGAVADVVDAGRTAVEPGLAVQELHARGHRRIHSEGGPVLFAAFQRAGAVDSLCLSISPLLGGGQARRIADGPGEELQALRLALLLEEDGALFAEYRPPRTCGTPPGHPAPGPRGGPGSRTGSRQLPRLHPRCLAAGRRLHPLLDAGPTHRRRGVRVRRASRAPGARDRKHTRHREHPRRRGR